MTIRPRVFSALRTSALAAVCAGGLVAVAGCGDAAEQPTDRRGPDASAGSDGAGGAGEKNCSGDKSCGEKSCG